MIACGSRATPPETKPNEKKKILSLSEEQANAVTDMHE